MVHQFLLFYLLFYIQPVCKGEEIEFRLAGPKYAIIKGDFRDSVFEKRFTEGWIKQAWGYQSLMADNRDNNGYCGYCKDEEYKGTLFFEEDFRYGDPNPIYGDSFFLQYEDSHNGVPLFNSIYTHGSGASSSCCDPVDITPVPGKVKLMSTKPLLADYIGLYSITRLLYNGFQQYERSKGGPRIYVNIYNQWVIGTQDHTEQIIMSQVEATPYFERLQPLWYMSIENVNEEDSIVTLGTETELLKSLGQPPECIIEGKAKLKEIIDGNYFYSNSLFKLTPEGTYKSQGRSMYDKERYYNQTSYGWWAQYDDTDWIEDERAGELWINPEEYRTSESSTVIPRLGWGERYKYAPENDISIIGSPCTITLVSNRTMDYAGTYNIEEGLLNGHPTYARDSEFGVYVNPYKKWVFGHIKENQANKEKEREDILVLSQDLTMTPLTWPEWSNLGTQQTPILTMQ